MYVTSYSKLPTIQQLSAHVLGTTYGLRCVPGYSEPHYPGPHSPCIFVSPTRALSKEATLLMVLPPSGQSRQGAPPHRITSCPSVLNLRLWLIPWSRHAVLFKTSLTQSKWHYFLILPQHNRPTLSQQHAYHKIPWKRLRLSGVMPVIVARNKLLKPLFSNPVNRKKKSTKFQWYWNNNGGRLSCLTSHKGVFQALMTAWSRGELTYLENLKQRPDGQL